MTEQSQRSDALPRRGLLIVLSSPSGAGKSTIARRLLAEDAAVQLSVSATTRPPRPGEVHGEDYFFVTKQHFDEMVTRQAMLEHAEVFGNRYGSPRAPVEAAVGAGADVLFDVDWQGATQLRGSPLRDLVVSIFILPPSIAEVERRLRTRATDTDDVITMRMGEAWNEISHWGEYDYVLINDDLEACYSRIGTIIAAERLRRERQEGLNEVIRRLNEEFRTRTP